MTAASTSSRTRSVVDQLRSTAEWQQQAEMPRSRPISWHPDSFEVSNFTASPAANAEDFSQWHFTTAQINGLITPVVYPSIKEPQIQELFTPLDELPGQDHTLGYKLPIDQLSWMNQDQEKIGTYSLPLQSDPNLIQLPNALDRSMHVGNVQTAPSSPDCVPLQDITVDPSSPSHEGPTFKNDPEELVAMGLYDSPAEIQSSSLLFSGLSGCGGKGLKLEESFEPTETEDVDEDDDDEEDESDREAEEQVAEIMETLSSSNTPAYDTHSIANHLAFSYQSQPAPLATEYLSTLRQMNSVYYPSDYHSYGWI